MRVPYHIGPMDEYSLAFVGAERDEIENWKQHASHWYVRYETVPSGDSLALAYTNSSRETEEGSSDSDEWSYGTRVLASAYLSAFMGVTSQASVSRNKSFDAEKIQRALTRVEWRQTVPEVAGELWSNLVLAHPLPNANHRSALALASLYLQTQDSRATLGLHVRDVPEVHELADEFFATSKKVLTVRRNSIQFRILADHGVKEIERKGGVIIPLDDYNLDVQDPAKEYARVHRDVSIDFFESYLVQSGLDELVSARDPGKNSVVQSLASLD